ncbi:MAG: hypothetical protein QM820_42340 [Minicystis sp.]
MGGVLAPACAPGSETPGTGGAGGTPASSSTSGTGGTVNDEGTCLLHNCNSDAECAKCDSGRTFCLESEHRCVACGANTTSGCPGGFECSSFGQCVPTGKTCPTDNGTPTITCESSADCVACDPAHQVCDTGTHQCVACTQNDTSECQSTDLCKSGKCSPKCPSICQTDNDCGLCGTAQNPAHACNAHNCAQCSPTYACPAGQVCTPHGTCEKRCGLEGPVEGTCDTDADCAGCGGGATHCYTPINGGHGKCGPEATGCSDLGNGTITLPSPFDKVTNTCSDDGDCAGVGITYNVGKLLRDLTGYDEINDANISYGMHACAAVFISDNISCGVCVPCRVDSDCTPIDIDQVAGDAFGTLGSIGAAILLDKIFRAQRPPDSHVLPGRRRRIRCLRALPRHPQRLHHRRRRGRLGHVRPRRLHLGLGPRRELRRLRGGRLRHRRVLLRHLLGLDLRGRGRPVLQRYLLLAGRIVLARRLHLGREARRVVRRLRRPGLRGRRLLLPDELGFPVRLRGHLGLRHVLPLRS